MTFPRAAAPVPARAGACFIVLICARGLALPFFSVMFGACGFSNLRVFNAI